MECQCIPVNFLLSLLDLLQDAVMFVELLVPLPEDIVVFLDLLLAFSFDVLHDFLHVVSAPLLAGTHIVVEVALRPLLEALCKQLLFLALKCQRSDRRP